jgi:hypothetical protein
VTSGGQAVNHPNPFFLRGAIVSFLSYLPFYCIVNVMAPLNLTELQELERLRKTPEVQQYNSLWEKQKDILWRHIDETDPPMSEEENQQIKVLDKEIKLLEKKPDVLRYSELHTQNLRNIVRGNITKFREAAHICSGNSKEEFRACMAEQLGIKKKLQS